MSVAIFDLGGQPLAIAFIGKLAFFATTRGEVIAATPTAGIEGRDLVHEDGMLFAVPDREGSALLTIGENGTVKKVTLGEIEALDIAAKPWPTALAAGPDGAIALAHQKKITLHQPGKPETALSAERMVQDLAFAPKGFRLA